MIKVKSLSIKGYKSINVSGLLEPKQINILIGANGVGKSNFIGFFRLLSWCVSSVDQFQNFVAESGFASALLCDGPEVTREIEADLILETETGLNEYYFRLVHGSGDILFFADEKVRSSPNAVAGQNQQWVEFGGGHKESLLYEKTKGDATAKVVFDLLRKVVVYQFHNTSAKSQIRNTWAVSDGRWLKENGSNLGSFLFRIFQEQPADYKRIVRIIRTNLPFYDDFVLENKKGKLLLRWKEKNSQTIFDATQASDGMLRFIALVALLAQNPGDLPAVVFIDEPELGLHPAAIETLAGLIKTASRYCQLFVATQSPAIVDMFTPEDIVVVERKERYTEFKRLPAEKLTVWLEEYSLSELLDKNVFGGQP